MMYLPGYSNSKQQLSKAGILLCLVFTFLDGYAQKYMPGLLIPYRNGKQWGYADTSGMIRIKPAFAGADFFEEDKRARVWLDKKQTYIDTLGKPLLPLFDSVFYLKYQAFLFLQNGRYGIYRIDKVTVPAEYNEFYPVENFPPYDEVPGKKVGLKGNRYYLVDYINGSAVFMGMERLTKTGNNAVGVVAPEYETNQVTVQVPVTVPVVKKNTAADSIQQQYGFDSVIAFPLRGYSKNGQYYEHYYKLYKNGKAGIQFMQHTILPAYQQVNEVYYEQYIQIFVRQNGMTGVINEKEEILVPIQYDGVKIITDKVFITTSQRKQGAVILDHGAKILPAKYDAVKLARSLYKDEYQVRFFKVFQVSLKGRNGYIGENGIEYFAD